ncbi:short-chain dehydrogenase/reductase SDR [Xylanimonas cellulosilytica DSM 15894]|uniref:Short-chain dehydrogenase/reductase SDR n=1 Tax=Xylanimonas cellulosilytica (strain DSM 15894 / JCM 12276 / CECT 5975 / KCTC 9989 / LMG 20990 / NBRC 107835 / XIL07) TaxID=446471 RepID=D1BRH8_XYLCX|nr:SDR family oxidoreductase [Xylanimonas cellulosilytica]ACZ30433.1 short-chain dehydrogenase/reductase SDR [Xylanimonas cellulosilytica DSM 15894]
MAPQEQFPPQQQEPPGLTGAMDPTPDHGEQSYRGTGRLAGRRALITGGDSGIGRATAIAFAREGADVAIGYLDVEQPDAEETARLVREAGRTACLLPGDLTDEAFARGIAQQAADGLGGLDVLVNNAGYQMARGTSIDTLDSAEMDRVIRTNLYALLWVTQGALAHLPSGGVIINVSSIQAYEPSGKLVDYASTKAAINNITVNLAAELGPRGIRVNAVAPGPIWTPLQPATQEAEHLPEFGTNVPLGRAGQPAEVAPALVFLASDGDASYVSGTVLGVTGGRPVF